MRIHLFGWIRCAAKAALAVIFGRGIRLGLGIRIRHLGSAENTAL
tara:strand:- start:1950 stop:2084 length:135 start_codon:yes stop_codon:yes gene_type:complete